VSELVNFDHNYYLMQCDYALVQPRDGEHTVGSPWDDTRRASTE